MGKSSNGAFALIRGKVGGVVFYKITDSNSKDKQGQRAYVGTIRNPNSTRQQYQRAILKTVSNMYAQGKAIFNHSFQGKSVGGANAREFRRLNMRALRAQCVADYNSGARPAGYRSFVSAKGSMYAAPNEYIVSQGTYDQKLFTWDNENKTFTLPSLSSENQTVAGYVAENGLIEGDIYTFVGLIVNKNVVAGGDGQTPYETNYKSIFLYSRFRVTLPTDTTVAMSNMSQVFQQLPSSLPNVNLSAISPGDDLEMDIFAGDIPKLGAIGCIRSREDQDLRSNSTMHLIKSTGLDAPGFGIISAFVPNYWADDAGNLGDSELLLEGGDANPTAGV